MKQYFYIPKMKLFTILIFLAIFFCGCSSTYTVRSTEAEDAFSYEQMNEELKERNVTIQLRDWTDIYAKKVLIANDSISWLNRSTDEKYKVRIGRLDKIVIKNHGLGILEGLGLGLLGGGGLGLLLAGITSSDSKNSEAKAWGFLIFSVLGASLGTVVGLLSGAISGHSYIYEFPIEQPSDTLRNGNSPQK